MQSLDAVDFLNTLAPGSVDVVFADPPYSSGGFTRGDRMAPTGEKYSEVGKAKGADRAKAPPDFGGDTKDAFAHLVWCKTWLMAAYRALRPGGHLWLCADWRTSGLGGLALQMAGFCWRGRVVWTKPCHRRVIGGVSHAAEDVLWATRGPLAADGRPAQWLRMAGKPGGPPQIDGEWRGSAPGGVKRRHLTHKPVGLVDHLLRLVWVHDGRQVVVADPFAGSGVVGEVCKARGFTYAGNDIDPDMAAAAQRAVDAVDADALRRHLDGLAALLPTADHDALGEPPGAEDVAEDMRGVL